MRYLRKTGTDAERDQREGREGGGRERRCRGSSKGRRRKLSVLAHKFILPSSARSTDRRRRQELHGVEVIHGPLPSCLPGAAFRPPDVFICANCDLTALLPPADRRKREKQATWKNGRQESALRLAFIALDVCRRRTAHPPSPISLSRPSRICSARTRQFAAQQA